MLEEQSHSPSFSPTRFVPESSRNAMVQAARVLPVQYVALISGVCWKICNAATGRLLTQNGRRITIPLAFTEV
jgi:hypothetical protein